MNIQQRITKLEQVAGPSQDFRQPLLVKFIGYGDEPREKAGILFVYHGNNSDTYNLNTQQLAEYEASERNGTTEAWLNTVPRPARAAV